MQLKKTSFSKFEFLNELVFKPCNLILKSIELEPKSPEYAAQNFQLNHYKILFRKAKVTPKKIGQFVTIWKRNDQGITSPFHLIDDFDHFIIATETPTNFGIFVFPKSILHENKIISDEKKEGKRGIRVYPIWDDPTSKQAQKTQEWQTKYFLDLTNHDKIDLNRAENLLSMESYISKR